MLVWTGSFSYDAEPNQMEIERATRGSLLELFLSPQGRAIVPEILRSNEWRAWMRWFSMAAILLVGTDSRRLRNTDGRYH